MGRKTDALERIATALERIAAALERPPAAAVEAPAAPAPQSLRAEAAPGSALPGPRAEAAAVVTGAPAGQLPGGVEATAAQIEAPAGDRTGLLRAWLGRRGVTVQREKGAAIEEEALLPIARFIGTQYERVKLVIDALKRGSAEGTVQSVSLKEQAPAVVTCSTHLSHQLHELALIEAFKYHRAPAYQLHLTPSRLPTAVYFITGGWLELYVRAVVLKALRAAHPEGAFSLLENLQVTLPTGEDFELDLLFEVEGEVWWVEMKSGGFQRHIAKYNRISRLLRLPPSRCFMVLCEANAEVCAKLSSLFAMSVIPVADAEAALSESIGSSA
ncbi:MAG: hypothetical protein JNM72_14270 [Deltaproteobacteria bacterium]|nr:hypothetical protein [Deltaproteobacteria bacterium]